MTDELKNKVEESKQIILDNYNKDDNAGFLFSCGKDSMIVDYLLKELGLRDYIYQFYTSTGFETNGIKEILSKRPDIIVIETDVEKYMKDNKIFYISNYIKGLYKQYGIDIFNNKLSCCDYMHIEQGKVISKFNKLFTGCKKVDVCNSMYIRNPVTTILDNKIIISPIFNWTEDECMEFIKENNIEICKDYDIYGSVLSCPLCPMYTTNNENMEKLKDDQPELYERYMNLIKYLYDNRSDLQELFGSLEEFQKAYLDRKYYYQKAKEYLEKTKK